MQTLLLYANYTDQLSYYDDWREAIIRYPLFDVKVVDLVPINRPALQSITKEIERAELIILHHSLLSDTLKYLQPIIASLKNRQGKLVAFVGNEVNLPILGMEPKITLFRELQVDIIITQLLLEAGQWLYKECQNANILSLPHALNPNAFKPGGDLSKREIDIGSRSVRYGIYLGDNERNDIVDFFRSNAQKFKLKVDLPSEQPVYQRFNRVEWCGFLQNCKMTISTESGSFYLQRNEDLLNSIIQFLKKHSNVIVYPVGNPWLDKLKDILPGGIKLFIKHLISLFKNDLNDADKVADLAVLKKEFFNEKNTTPFYSKAISSRHFDAIGTKTLNVMFEGRFNDILKPNQHYFALKRDFSNIDALMDLLQDVSRVQKMTDQTYNYVLNSHTHRNRLDMLASQL